MTWTRKPTKRQNPYNEGSSTIHGLNSEDRVVKSMGGKKQIGSGALDGLKSDGVKEAGEYTFRMECKATVKQSMSLKYDWLYKIRTEARQSGMLPALTVSFVDAAGKAKPAGDWIMIPAYVMKELMDRLEIETDGDS